MLSLSLRGFIHQFFRSSHISAKSHLHQSQIETLLFFQPTEVQLNNYNHLYLQSSFYNVI